MISEGRAVVSLSTTKCVSPPPNKNIISFFPQITHLIHHTKVISLVPSVLSAKRHNLQVWISSHFTWPVTSMWSPCLQPLLLPPLPPPVKQEIQSFSAPDSYQWWEYFVFISVKKWAFHMSSATEMEWIIHTRNSHWGKQQENQGQGAKNTIGMSVGITMLHGSLHRNTGPLEWSGSAKWAQQSVWHLTDAQVSLRGLHQMEDNSPHGFLHKVAGGRPTVMPCSGLQLNLLFIGFLFGRCV